MGEGAPSTAGEDVLGDGCLWKQVLVASPERARRGYQGDELAFLLDGAEEEYTYQLGEGGVVPAALAWASRRAVEGLLSSLGLGEKASFSVAPSLWATPVADTEPRKLEVELRAVRTVADCSLLGDRSVLKKSLAIPADAGWERPEAGLPATVSVQAVAADGTCALDAELELTVGLVQHCHALECVVPQMRLGETAEVLCRDGSLFEDAKLGIPPGVAKLVVTLKAFPVFKPFELSKGERFAHLQKLKDTANAQLKAGLYVWALGKYMRVLALAGEERMKSAVADLGTEVPLCDFVAMQRSCKSNLALVWLKLEQWAELRQVCDDLLAEDATDAKARLRRGQALMELGEFAIAEADFRAVTPATAESKRLQVKAREAGKKAKDSQKAVFARMMHAEAPAPKPAPAPSPKEPEVPWFAMGIAVAAVLAIGLLAMRGRRG